MELPESTPSPSPSRTPSQQNKDDLYTNVEIALDHSRADPVIHRELQRLQWTERHFAKLDTLLEEALTLETEADTTSGSQVASTQDVTRAVRDANAEYVDIVVTLKDEIEDADVYRSLGLHDARESYKNFNAWLQQARRFFAAALDDAGVRGGIEKAGIDLDFVRSGREHVEAVAEMNIQQERAKETYESSSERLQQVRQELRAWYGKLVRRARRALRQYPQKLEAVVPGAGMEANV